MSKRKLKTMAALLAEYPDTHFNSSGHLCYPGIEILIHSYNFDKLGKDNDDSWDERLLEPAPEPVKRGKLYAYESQMGWVHISKHENINSDKRLPEYNIDLGEIDELKVKSIELENKVIYREHISAMVESNLATSIDDLKNSVGHLVADNDGQEAELTHINTKIRDLSARAEALESAACLEYADLLKRFEKSEERIDELESIVQTSTNLLNQTRMELGCTASELEATDELASELEKRVSKLDRKLEHLESSSEKSERQLLDRIEKLEEVSILAKEFKETMQKMAEAHKIACEPKIKFNMPLKED